MPSGAKKRKAAKKKKEKEANIHPSSNYPQGNDDLKSQDEKGSDGGEVSSPAYHDDDDHRHPFDEGNEEEVDEMDPSAAQPAVPDFEFVEEVLSDNKIARAVEGKEDVVVNIERDLKSEESSDNKNVSVELMESASESYIGNRNPSGTSNDESLPQKNSNDESYNLVQETIENDDLVKSVDSPPAKMTLITETLPVQENGDSVVESSASSLEALASVSEVKSSDIGSAVLESIVPQEGMTDLAMKKNEDKAYPLSGENVRTSSVEEASPKEYDSKVSVSLPGTPFTESTNGAQHVKDSETPECSENQPLGASAPHMVQKTSWLSCCGLFDFFSGSNR